MAIATAAARADELGAVHYDPKGDQLIVTIIYDGTNADHHFSIQRGSCGKLEQTRGQPERPGLPPYQTTVWIIDEQGNDAAKKRYTKTISVPLAALSCRPIRVTLVTSPVLYSTTTLDVP